MSAFTSKALKIVTTYVSPVLTLVSFILALLVYLSPVLVFGDQVSLGSVISTSSDGQELHVGLLGSCERKSASAVLNCTAASLTPAYDMSDLPSTLPSFLDSPVSSTPVFEMLALVLHVVFLVSLTLGCARERLPRLGHPMIGRVSAYSGVLSFMITTTVYLVMRMWLGRAADDFNLEIGKKGGFEAVIGNGFSIIWAALALSVVPVVCALARVHGSPTPAGKV